jgi:hypothetical protein
LGRDTHFGTAEKTVTGKLPCLSSPPLLESEPVLEPWYQIFQPFGAIGFPLQRRHNPVMPLPGKTGSWQTRALCRLLCTGAALLAMSWSLFADTPARLHAAPSPGCYCRCAPARRLGSCVKICELPKYASRWWAVSCAKPHGRSAGDNRGAGPRLHHRDRAEHARL